ncbi:hypothetical protein ACN27E_12020 [Mycobacterium sp. WMMD1722]|uniref:hypothetical protein n=1 Tax=Mycobacterium sp. WMMD1722 TaxID=3404117 RepID=UPI003BF56155
MPSARLTHAAAGFLLTVAAVVTAAPAGAEPLNPIPSDGFFLAGRDIAPGLYRSAGTASTWAVWINDVPTEGSMCVWFTYGTPAPDKDHIVATNMSIGPIYANINDTVMAFESRNCQPWTRT